MIFGSVRFALFVKSLKTVRFALFNEKTEPGGLFGAVRLAVKTETENGVFFLRFGKRFSLKNGKRHYGAAFF